MTPSATPQQPGTPVQKPVGPTRPPNRPIHRTPKQPPAKPGSFAAPVRPDAVMSAVLDVVVEELQAVMARLNLPVAALSDELAARIAALRDGMVPDKPRPSTPPPPPPPSASGEGGTFATPQPVGAPRFVEGEHRLVGGYRHPAAMRLPANPRD